jgi:UV DNA damage repair endonuclease
VDKVDKWSLRSLGVLVGQEPNNSVYLAPLVTEVVSSSILLLISYHTKLFARLCIVIRRLVILLNVLQKRNRRASKELLQVCQPSISNNIIPRIQIPINS